MKRAPFRSICLLLCAVAVLSGCNKAPGDIPGANHVLATVDGDPITQFDVDRAAARLLGPQRLAGLDQASRQKVLESLVLSRAISRAEDRQLDKSARYWIDKETQDYREDLLVKRYLKDNANPKPVTEEMIAAYYREHPEQFGGGTHKRYQLLFVTRDLSDKERQQVLQAYAVAPKQADWKRWTQDLSRKHLPVSVQEGTTPTSLPNKTLDDVLTSLAPGKVSDVAYVNGRPYLLRVTGTFSTQPRPLDDVRADVRRQLLPVRIKQTLDDVSKQVLGTAKVKYLDSGDGK